MTALVDASGLALAGRLEPTDLRIERPQLICLVGPNGSGKTSLLHALAGIGRPGGQVAIAGTDLRGAPPSARRRMLSFLPASRDVAWPLSARDLIQLGLPSASETDAALKSLELLPFADRRMDRLSTGERSRVLIARALAPRPRLLLLDEPVANLDPLWQLRLMDLLVTLTRQHDQAVLIALHDLDLAARYADRLIVMDGGRVTADGTPDTIMHSDAIGTVFGIEKGEGGWRPL